MNRAMDFPAVTDRTVSAIADKALSAAWTGVRISVMTD
jgi:hypothetical protein